MELANLLVGIATLLSVIIAGLLTWTSSVKSKKLNNLSKELLELYMDVHQLLQIETDLTEEIGAKKNTVRKPYTLSKRIEPKHVEKRIAELESIYK